jgi:preprotein translocase subunit SecE
VSDDRREHGDESPAVPDAELTDEQLDREAPGVDDAAELEAAEAEVAAEAAEEEDKVVPAPQRRRRGAITSEGRDDEAAPARTPRPARAAAARSASGPGGTRSRAAAQQSRAQEIRRRRSLGRFLREVVAELRKVIWPGRRELITYTTVVILFVAVMVALVAGLDLLFAKGVIAVFG